MIVRMQEDLPVIERIMAMKNIADPAARNQAVLAWIESHKEEFGGGHFEGNKMTASTSGRCLDLQNVTKWSATRR